MNKKLKVKWVKALRSGKYRQAEGELRSKNGAYCCLGVLRSVMHPGSSKVEDNYLCLEHQKEAGLTLSLQQRLGDMNDRGKSFSHIADWIQKHL